MKPISEILEERNEIAMKLILSGKSFADASITATQYVQFAYGDGVFEKINNEINPNVENNEQHTFNIFLYKQIDDTITLLRGALSSSNNIREDCKIAIENLNKAIEILTKGKKMGS